MPVFTARGCFFIKIILYLKIHQWNIVNKKNRHNLLVILRGIAPPSSMSLLAGGYHAGAKKTCTQATFLNCPFDSLY